VSSGSFYIGVGRLRHSELLARAIGAGLLALSLGGCAAIGGLPLGELAQNHPLSSQRGPLLASARATDTVDPSDWEMVRRAVTNVSAKETPNAIEWQNPDTGSSGTISSLAAAAARTSSALCRGFATTVNDFTGVRRYRGQACQLNDGRWQLFGVKLDDAMDS
jgi:surface antigen